MREAIDHAHRLGLQVIGQQIEDPQAAAAMWMGGVDYIQGNLVQSVATISISIPAHGALSVPNQNHRSTGWVSWLANLAALSAFFCLAMLSFDTDVRWALRGPGPALASPSSPA